MMTWKQYANRRRVEIISWMRVNSITCYGDFVDVCNGKGIVPPTETEMNRYIELEQANITPLETVTQEPVVISDPVPGSVIRPEPPVVEVAEVASEPEPEPEPETVQEANDAGTDNDVEDPADLGIYEVDDNGFLVAKKPTPKKVFSGGKLKSSKDLGGS